MQFQAKKCQQLFNKIIIKISDYSQKCNLDLMHLFAHDMELRAHMESH